MPAALDRLKKRSEFLAVASANRRWTTPGLVLQARAADAPGRDGLRVGFTATKKIGNAVMRNRARRRLRAVVSDILKNAPAAPTDLVVVARQGTVKRPYLDLKSDLEAALRRLGVVR